MCSEEDKNSGNPQGLAIEGKIIDMPTHYLSPVSYVKHDGDVETGVLIRCGSDNNVFVLYCESRTVQSTWVKDLTWG